MENRLKALFELQRFEQDPELAKVIADSESRLRVRIPDEQLDELFAAGEPDGCTEEASTTDVGNEPFSIN